MNLVIHDASLRKVAFVDNTKQNTLKDIKYEWYRSLETAGVLPACAGVILANKSLTRPTSSFTRMRGGDPDAPFMVKIPLEFYPHARG